MKTEELKDKLQTLLIIREALEVVELTNIPKKILQVAKKDTNKKIDDIFKKRGWSK